MNQNLLTREEFASIQQVQAGTSRLLEGAARRGAFIRVIKNSKPIGVLLPNTTFESLAEDLAALSSNAYLRNLAESRKQGGRYSAKTVKRLLGL